MVARGSSLLEPGELQAAVDALLPRRRPAPRPPVGVQQAPPVQTFLAQSVLPAKLCLVPGRRIVRKVWRVGIVYLQ